MFLGHSVNETCNICLEIYDVKSRGNYSSYSVTVVIQRIRNIALYARLTYLLSRYSGIYNFLTARADARFVYDSWRSCYFETKHYITVIYRIIAGFCHFA